jgi:hypothetical protein
MAENFIPLYDLESLTEPQRQEYLKAVCKHLGVPDNLNLVALTYVDDTEGPSRLVPYAKRGATENVRNALQIDVTSLTNQMVNGSIVFTATATSKIKGRQEVAAGSKFIEGLQGAVLDDAIMTASTRALRRVTLQFIGAGVLDESEVNQRKTIHITSAPATPAPQPTVLPSSEPGKVVELVTDGGPRIDTTMFPPASVKIPAAVDFATGKTWETQEKFEADQAKLRADAIAQLNAKIEKVAPAEEIIEANKKLDLPKKTRKPRGPNKKKVDLGPSDNPQPDIKPDIHPAPITPIPVAPSVPELPKPDIQPVISAPAKPRLPVEQTKPFRQRHFQIMNKMEMEGGFTSADGMGRAAKMRGFAMLMFPEITDMNDLSVEQWERYLTTLENKIKTEGPTATVQYVEDAIGL